MAVLCDVYQGKNKKQGQVNHDNFIPGKRTFLLANVLEVAPLPCLKNSAFERTFQHRKFVVASTLYIDITLLDAW